MIKRALILGHSGFIGGALMRTLGARPGLTVEGVSPGTIDLTNAQDAGSLAAKFTPETAVILCSAIRRQDGDNQENFFRNLSMAANLAPLLAERPVGRFVYFSSAAVYGEDVEGRGIGESTPVRPTSYYGAAKFAAECLLRKAVEKQSPSPLLILRPPTVYGPGGLGAGSNYSPAGFLLAALRGRPLTLWGDGSELREFVLLDDLVRVVDDLLDHPFSGTLNVVSGVSRSFREAADIAYRLADAPARIDERPRSKNKADHGFNGSLLRSLLPGFQFASLEDGMRRLCESERAAASAGVPR